MDATYTLVRDLLRGNALSVFKNEQATFKEETPENLKYCLNAMTIQVFQNKAYKIQKQYI
eukprot:10244921-Ditylum_brightwellii.AAC.3